MSKKKSKHFTREIKSKSKIKRKMIKLKNQNKIKKDNISKIRGWKKINLIKGQKKIVI